MTLAEFSNKTFGQQYELQELLDDNGIVQTYRAFQKSLKRLVAIHVLAPHYRPNAQWSQALVRGAEIAARYAHPNIVPVYDHGIHEGISYIVLRLMEGGTLMKRLQSHPLELPETVSITKQIAASLDYVHSQGDCHGDPATVNIVFDQMGIPFLADFYLLGFLQATAPELVAGVPAYMAPERMSGHPPDALTDQYALAGVAYHMLTGKAPWETAYLKSPENLIPPQEHRPEIPLAVNSVLVRALAIDPQERFPTVMDFARQFEQALKGVNQHIFISYSRVDSAYVQELRAYLQQNGLHIWLDDQIEHGEQWFNDIHNAIKTSAALLVVMSPEAEQSEWVHKEILLAKRYHKPIFPLLLRGQELPILIDLQFADVRDGAMPDADFHRRIARSVYGS